MLLEESAVFLDRDAELAFLNTVQRRAHPGPAQLIMLYGRRRIGKTALLHHWAEGSGLPFTYYAAEKEPAPLQRRKLFATLLGLSPGAPTNPAFESWSDLWRAAASYLEGKRHILVFDELPYAAESDPATLSALQHAWDHHFQHSQVILALCGSHVRTMELLLSQQSPLFGRLTGQWHLRALPYSALRAFMPTWSPEERIAAYAIVGGVPTYLRWLDPARSLVENIRHVMLAPGSLVLAEVDFLLYDEVREPRTYLAILQAIGGGAHALKEIANASLVSTTNLSSYLAQLQELRLVERRQPATLPPNRQRIARQGRYHLSDPFFRFYFRFLQPYQGELSYQPERVLPTIQQGLRAFVGQTAFEELCRQWVRERGTAGALPFAPQAVGSHWSKLVQVDVVAANFQTRDILLGECKWGVDRLDRQVVRDLVETKAPLALRDLPDGGQGWTLHYALFGRGGFTPAARAEAARHGARIVDAATLDRELA
jgi:AAA+ ATPase superfamily predicted ATPase